MLKKCLVTLSLLALTLPVFADEPQIPATSPNPPHHKIKHKKIHAKFDRQKLRQEMQAHRKELQELKRSEWQHKKG